MNKRPKIIEEKPMDKSIDKPEKPLRTIHNIEALRKKIGCTSYDELKILGYDVDGYFSRKEEDRKEAMYSNTIPIGYDSDGCYWGT